MESLTPTHYWVILGLLLIILEIFTLSFFIFFFGVGALVIAALRIVGVLDNFALEMCLFGVFGFSGLLVFRKAILRNLHRARGIDIDRAATVVLSEDIPARGNARVEYQGTLWDATNESDRALVRGDTAVIVRTEGIKLILQPRDPVAGAPAH